MIDALGLFWSSCPRSYSDLSLKSGAHISSWLSLLKDSSRAPATVPDTRRGSEKGDHANVAVRCISFNFMAVDVGRSE